MRHLAVLFAATAVLYATQAVADGGAPAATDAPPAATDGLVCGHMQMQADGTLTAPAGVDKGTIESARGVIGLYQMDVLFDRLSTPFHHMIDRERKNAKDDAARANIAREENDFPVILATLRQDMLDTYATGIACHLAKSDLDVTAAYLRTPAGHKFAAAAVSHTQAEPALSAEESGQMRDYSSTEACRHIAAELRNGSQTDSWINAEMPLVNSQIAAWLRAKYPMGRPGGSL